MLKLYKDMEKISLRIGKGKGVNVTFQHKSYVDGETPFYALTVFVWGTFLWFDKYWDPRCCSNGVTLLSWSQGGVE